MTRRVRGFLTLAACLPLVLTAAAAVIGQAPLPASAQTLAHPGPAASPQSIVQLGDSVASGEGTLYGYRYDAATQTWTGGNIDANWPGPYLLCHDSPDAYGQLLASSYHAQLSLFACTGASFANGISAPRVNYGYLYNTTLRPAEFGNWDNQQYLILCVTSPRVTARVSASGPAVMGVDGLQAAGICCVT